MAVEGEKAKKEAPDDVAREGQPADAFVQKT
jgi:hypothetical protein